MVLIVLPEGGKILYSCGQVSHHNSQLRLVSIVLEDVTVIAWSLMSRGADQWTKGSSRGATRFDVMASFRPEAQPCDLRLSSNHEAHGSG